MTGTEKELILLGLFFVVAVNEDSAVVSGAVPELQTRLSCVAALRRLLSRDVDERFRRLRRIQIWGPQVARLPLDASIRFTQTGAARHEMPSMVLISDA